MGNFKLWFGCLGNGVTVCNSVVQNNGEFKHIAHISPEGKIKLYVSENYIPNDAMQKIEAMAISEKEKFLEYWDKLTDIQKFEKLLDDYVEHSVFMEICSIKKEYTLKEKVEKLEKIYIL